MEGARQLGGLHNDLWVELKQRHALLRKGAFYPKSDNPIELQPFVLDQFGHFPTGNDAHAEKAVSAMFEKFPVARLQPIRPRNPPDPNVGV